MEGTYGSIRYKVIITFDISNYTGKVFEAGFTVLKTCNLNDFPELKVLKTKIEKINKTKFSGVTLLSTKFLNILPYQIVTT